MADLAWRYFSVKTCPVTRPSCLQLGISRQLPSCCRLNSTAHSGDSARRFIGAGVAWLPPTPLPQYNHIFCSSARRKGGRDAVVSLDRGTKLGPYEIVALIGAGGMGEVYKARDARLDRIVAVKISAEQ